jgi:non-specific serine/threonine protein kinase
VAAEHGDHERVLRLAAVADRMSREWSLSTGSFRHGQLDEACRSARAKLGVRKGDATWSDGEAMSPARALEFALGAEAAPPDTADSGPLSRREQEVVAMVAAGMTNREIAERLFIAERTAEGHVERIRNKLGVRSRTEVATWAVEQAIVTRDLDKSPPGSSV